MERFTDTALNLEILAEECAEVQQIKAKIYRFGLDDQHPTYPTNRARLEEELGHVIAMVRILTHHGVITEAGIEKGVEHKMGKLHLWYNTKPEAP